MFALLLAATWILGSAQSLSLQQHLIRYQWEGFKIKFEKSYESPDEEEYRLTVYMKNLETILEHNKLYHMGLSTYTMGMNEFGDLTDEEFQRYYLTQYDSLSEENSQDYISEDSNTNYLDDHSVESLPEFIDWRLLGAVTEVKHQGQCGSCYAFSAAGALEAQHYLATKTLISLSEQNIVDCTYKTKQYKNKGCLGGRVDTSFRYIIDNGGIDTADSYPYVAAPRKCMFNATNIGAKMTKFQKIKSGNETQLQIAVARIGPVSIMADANGMKFYSGGIYNNLKCSSDKYTHGMLAVGYGRYRNVKYWVVKNSWGINWGENGYMMMIRNKGNQCAIATEALYPFVA